MLLKRRHHDFGYEVDNGGGGLFRFKFGEYMAGVLRTIGDFPRHEAEDSDGHTASYGPPSLLWVQPTECHRIDRIVPAEKQLAGVVSHCDSLSRNLEVHADRRQLLLLGGEQRLIDGSANCFGPCQRLRIA